jgi:ADP-heptose:LPS heptosyltransferase
MIVTTGLIRNLHESGYDVYVSSRTFSLDIIKHNPYVKGTFIYDDSSFKHLYKSIKNVRKEKFDLAVEVRCNRMIHLSNIIFCSYVKTKILVGYNKSSLPSFNISIPYYQPNDHVTNQLLCFLNLLKIKNNDMQYQLFNDDNEENKSELFLKKIANNEKK